MRLHRFFVQDSSFDLRHIIFGTLSLLVEFPSHMFGANCLLQLLCCFLSHCALLLLYLLPYFCISLSIAISRVLSNCFSHISCCSLLATVHAPHLFAAIHLSSTPSCTIMDAFILVPYSFPSHLITIWRWTSLINISSALTLYHHLVVDFSFGYLFCSLVFCSPLGLFIQYLSYSCSTLSATASLPLFVLRHSLVSL